MPTAVASSAAARAVRSARSGSNAPASAIGIGNTVARPWITSPANTIGIFSRLPSIAAFCACRAPDTPTPLNSMPILPALMSASCAAALLLTALGLNGIRGGRIASPKHESCPAFSASVIRAIRLSIRSLWARAIRGASAKPASMPPVWSSERREIG